MTTADENAANEIGRAVDNRIGALNAEKQALLLAPARIASIDAELAILQVEKARIDPRRPAATLPVAAGDSPQVR